jgi:predicted phage tail protein
VASFVDDFERPDSATLGSGWREYTAGFHIVSGAAVCDTTATNVGQYATDLASGDHYGEMTIGNTYGGTFTGVAVRMPTIGTDGASSGPFYLMLLSGSTGTGFSIRRKENASATLTTLATATSTTDGRVDGSVWRLEANTNPSNSAQVLLRAYLNDVLVVSGTDASTTVPATQRRVGIYTGGSTGPDLRIGRVAGADLTLASDTTPPTVPGSVTAQAVSGTSVTVSWSASTDNTSVASYRVRRDGVDVSGATALTVLTFTETGLAAGTYGYTVSAVDAAGNRSGESPVASVTLTPPDTTPPPVPTGLAATAGTAQVGLSWTAVSASDLAGYRVYRWTAAAPTHTLVGSPTTAAFTDSGVTAGTAYSYAVRSIDQTGNLSAESGTATATPTAPSGGGPVFTRWSGTAEAAVTLSGVWTGSTTTPVVSVQIAP